MTTSYECTRLMHHRCRWHPEDPEALSVTTPCTCTCHAVLPVEKELRVLRQKVFELSCALEDRDARLKVYYDDTCRLTAELAKYHAEELARTGTLPWFTPFVLPPPTGMK